MSLDLSFSPNLPKVIKTQLNLESNFKSFLKTINSEDYGFFTLKNLNQDIEECQNIYKKFKTIKTFVHVGIGGSSLSAEMFHQIFQKADSVNFIFINNIDPEEIHRRLSNLKIDETLFYFVSKSGTTAETAAALSIILNLLHKNKIKELDYNKYLVFASDNQERGIGQLAIDLKCHFLRIPSNIGGRFSAFTSAAILPLCFLKVDIKKIVSGLDKIKKEISESESSNSQILRLATHLYDQKNKNGVNLTVLMPYSSRLKSLSAWFAQLWAESLGKKSNLKGETVHVGLTPIAAFGATDQHSQMQLFKDGPKDKFLIFIKIKNFQFDYSLSNKNNSDFLKILDPFSLSELFDAEFYGTVKSLEDSQIPYSIIELEKLDEYNLAQIILFLECLTVLMGELFKINPFDQPGVELAKKYALEWLTKKTPKS